MRLFLFFLKYVYRFLRFYWRAQTKYDVHSPFVAAFVANTIEDHRHYYIFDRVVTVREKLALNDDLIPVVDYGAGSQVGDKSNIKVNKIARYSAISPAAGRLLFRIARFLHPGTFLELGTSLGISAIYQISANIRGHLTSIEGNPAIAELARKNLKAEGFDQVRVLDGPFREILPDLLSQSAPVDFFHFDGDHRYGPTIENFERCLLACSPNSVFCIGDIYWSAEMEKAWNYLKQHPRVRLSIDLFHFGLLFLRTEQLEKQDFTLVPAWMKPWRMGFWK